MAKHSAFEKPDEVFFSVPTVLGKRSSLRLAHSSNYTEQGEIPLDEHSDGSEGEYERDFESDQEEFLDHSNTNSSFNPYFKDINRFGLLTEEEEKNLAISIKESEGSFISLVIQFDRFLKRNVIPIIPAAHKKEMLQRIKKANIIFQTFDGLIGLEKERKQIKRSQKQLTHSVHSQNELEEKLYAVETTISKKIAHIKLTEHSVKTVLKRVRKQLDGFTKTVKEKKVAWELAHRLREMSRLVEEIKRLKNELVKRNLRLVITIARRYLHHGIPLEDLIQEGNLGLIRAIDTYDYRKGHRFITYAVWWIRQAVLRMIDCHARTVRIPVYLREKMNKIEKVSVRLFAESSKEPTCEQIADEIDTPLGEIEKVKQSFKDALPIDELMENNTDVVLNSAETVKQQSGFQHAVFSELTAKVDRLLSLLTMREREILKLRFGLGKRRDYTLDEIGKKMGLSRERIRQILEKVLKELKTTEGVSVFKDYIEVH